MERELSECKKKAGRGAGKSTGQLKTRPYHELSVNMLVKNAAGQQDCESVFIYLSAKDKRECLLLKMFW